jgi:hypothetical protein
MRKIVLFIAALLFMAVPVMAATNVDVNTTVNGNWVTVDYNTHSDANLIRAFGLDITVDNGAKITQVVALDANYRIYPGQIVIVDGNVIDYNTPYAPGDLSDANVTIEMGSLYTTDQNYAIDPLDPNNDRGYNKKPHKSGHLLKFYVDKGCNYTVAGNARRGDIVMENPRPLPNVTFHNGKVCPPLPGAATNLTPADLATCVSTTASLNWTAGAGTDSHLVRFGTANPPPVVTTLPVGTTTYSPAMTNNKLYNWRIDEKENSCGGITTGVQWSFTTVPVPPAVPASCTVNGGVLTDADGKYTVTWTAPVGGGATSYQLESKTTITPSIPDGWVQVYSGPLLTYSEKVGGGIWSYQVKATNCGGSSVYTGGSNTCTISPIGCLKSTDPGYAAWQTWRYPACWCYQRQCRGDTNGKKTSGAYVSSADFTLFKSANLVDDVNLAKVPNGICADLNHKKTSGARVSSADFTIFRTYNLQPDVNVPSCDLAPVITYYNFWTTP